MHEIEKQLTPLEGEVELEEARLKASVFASQIKMRLKSKGLKVK
jgi:hypothetical protein